MTIAISTLGAAQTYTEQTSGTRLFTAFDGNNATITQSRITRISVKIASNYFSTDDLLRYNSTGLNPNYALGGYIQAVTYNKGTGTLDIYSKYPRILDTTDLQTILGRIEYQNLSLNPTNFNAFNSKNIELKIFSQVANRANVAETPIVINHTINITPINNAPVINRRITPVYTINQETEFETFLPQNAFSDADSQSLTFSVWQQSGASTTQLTTGSGLFRFDAANDFRVNASRTLGNADVGNYNFIFKASDGSLTTSQSFTLNVKNINDAPFVANALTFLSITQSNSQVSTTLPSNIFDDPDLILGSSVERLRYTLSGIEGKSLPYFIQYNQLTRQVIMTPTNNLVGDYVVSLKAIDLGGKTATNDFTIRVVNANDAPIITKTIPRIITNENQTFAINLKQGEYFSDPDFANPANKESLTFSLSSVTFTRAGTFFVNTNTGSWISYDSQTGLLTGTPSNKDVGNYSFTLRAIDKAGASVAQNVTIQVNNVNAAPSVSSFASRYNDDGSPSIVTFFTENTSSVLIAPSIILLDSDSDINSTTFGINSAEISILNPFAGDSLTLGGNPFSLGIQGDKSTIIRLDGFKTLAQYQQTLRTITFSNKLDNISPESRKIAIRVVDNEGKASELTVFNTKDTIERSANGASMVVNTEYFTPNYFNLGIITINDAPSVALVTNNINATERTITQLLPNIVLSDIDSPSLTRVEIVLNGNSQTEDILGIVGTLPAGVGYNYNNGTLIISGSALLTNYQSILRQVSYYNNSYDPTHNATGLGTVNPNRTFTVRIFDTESTNNVSIIKEGNINITTINNSPFVEAKPITIFTRNKENGNIFVNSMTNFNFGITDLDDAKGDVIVNYSTTGGKFFVGGTQKSAIDNFTLEQLQNNLVTFKIDNVSITQASAVTIQYQVFDLLGLSSGKAQSLTINLRPENFVPSFTQWNADDNNGVFSVNENSQFVKQFGLNYFTDGDNHSLTFTTLGIDKRQRFVDDTTVGINNGTLPSWLIYDSASRRLIGTPKNSDVGVYTLQLRATDVYAATGLQNFTITVNNVNDAPILSDSGTNAVNIYTEKQNNFALIANSVSFNDVDFINNNPMSWRISATIAVNSQSGDILSATNLPFAAQNFFTSSYDSQTATLVIAATSNTTSQITPETIQTIIKNIGFTNRTLNPTTAIRNIDIRVSDGSNTSLALRVKASTELVDDGPSYVSVPDNALLSTSENIISNLFTFKASDPEGDPITYTAGGIDGKYFTLINTNGAGNLVFRQAPNFENKLDASASGIYSVTILASAKAYTASYSVFVSVTDEDEAPEFRDSRVQNASGASPFVIRVNENISGVFLNLSATDPESDNVIYQLAGVDSGKFNFVPSAGTLQFNFIPDFENPSSTAISNIYSLTMSTKSTHGANGQLETFRSITVIVDNVVELPGFTTGDYGSIAENTSGVAYRANAKGDSNINPVYKLSLFNDSAFFSINESTGDVSIKPNNLANFEAKSSYNILITATANNVSYVKSVIISVGDLDEAPSFTSNLVQSASENLSPLNLAYLAKTFDPDGNSVTYSFISDTNNDTNLFNLDSATGAITFKNSPDFEFPSDKNADNTYILWLSATSTGASNIAQGDFKEISVVVVNKVEAPIFSSPLTANINENLPSATVLYSAAALGDQKTPTIFTLQPSAQNNLLFNISTDGLLRLNSPANYEENNRYTVQITGTAANRSANYIVQVTINDVNEAPSVTSDSTTNVSENDTQPFYYITYTDPDNVDVANISYELLGDDAKFFDINVAGRYIFAKNNGINFEDFANRDQNNIYSVTLKITTGTGARAISNTAPLIISVANIVEAPYFFSGDIVDISASENLNVSQIIFTPSTQGENLAARSYWLAGSDADKFTIDPNNGRIKFISSPDYEIQPNYEVNIFASTANASGFDSYQTIRIHILDVVETMSFTSNLASATQILSENTSATLLYCATVNDPNHRDNFLRYSLSGTDSQFFTINEINGQLRNIAPLNFEGSLSQNGNNNFTFNIIADNGLNSITQVFSFALTNLGETDGFTAINGNIINAGLGASYVASNTDTIMLNENNNISDTIYVANFRNGKAGGGFYALGNYGDANAFNIDSRTGVIRANSSFNYENPPNNHRNLSLQVQFISSTQQAAFAAGSLANSQINSFFVDVNLQNIVEPVQFSNTTRFSVAEGNKSAFRALGYSDFDTTLRYEIVSSADSSKFSVNSITGEVAFIANTDFQNPTDSNADNTYVVRIQGKTIDYTTIKAITEVSLTVLTNSQPLAFASTPLNYKRPENDDPFVYNLSASGDSSQYNITYQFLTGTNDNAYFRLNSLTGIVEFVNAPSNFNNLPDNKSSFVIQLEAFTGISTTAANYASKTFSFSVFDVKTGFWDLPSSAGFLLRDFGSLTSRLGNGVAILGDVNGDGIADFGLVSDNLETHVIYGRNGSFASVTNIATFTSSVEASFADIASGGRITDKIVALGDINGDGLADFGITTKYGNASATNHYIAFGGTAGQFTIRGLSSQINSNNLSNQNTISGGGDINGDGFDDFIIHTGFHSNTNFSNLTYILYGKSQWRSAINYDLNNLASDMGRKITGTLNAYIVNDLNNDGRGEVILTTSSATYIIYGSNTINNILSTNPENIVNRIKISGTYAGINAIGDFNGDNLNDIILYNANQAAIIYGSSTISHTDITSTTNLGLFINNLAGSSITSVDAAGDFNGDGYADIIIGVADDFNRAGRSYLIFGNATYSGASNIFDLANFVSGVHGIGFTGRRNDAAGYAVSGGQDINGDGLADIIVGAPDGNNGSGTGYVMYGQRNFLKQTPLDTIFIGSNSNVAVQLDSVAIEDGNIINKFYLNAGNDSVQVNVRDNYKGYTIDGGLGIDTLEFNFTTNASLTMENFTQKPNLKITNFEQFNFNGGSGQYVFVLNENNLLDLSGAKSSGTTNFSFTGTSDDFIYLTNFQQTNQTTSDGYTIWRNANGNISAFVKNIQNFIVQNEDQGSMSGTTGTRDAFIYDFNTATNKTTLLNFKYGEDILHIQDANNNITNFEALTNQVSAVRGFINDNNFGQYDITFNNSKILSVEVSNHAEASNLGNNLQSFLLRFGSDNFVFG